MNIEWTKGELTSASLRVDDDAPARPVKIVYNGKDVASFTTSGGLQKEIRI